MTSRQDHQVQTAPIARRRAEQVLVRPETFSHQALDPVAPDRTLADTGRYGESEAGMVKLVGTGQHAETMVIRCPGFRKHALELLRSGQSQMTGKGVGPQG